MVEILGTTNEEENRKEPDSLDVIEEGKDSGRFVKEMVQMEKEIKESQQSQNSVHSSGRRSKSAEDAIKHVDIKVESESDEAEKIDEGNKLVSGPSISKSRKAGKRKKKNKIVISPYEEDFVNT